MSSDKLLLQSREFRPTGGDAEPQPSAFSPELLAQTRARLGYLALFSAGLTLVVHLVMVVQIHGLGWDPTPVWPKLRGVQLSMIVFSVIVFGLTRWRELPDDAMPTLGMGYMLLAAFLFSLPGFTSTLLLQDNMGRLPWVGMWIALFPLVVPLPPVRCAIMSFAAATLPLGIFVTWSMLEGQTLPPGNVMVATFFPIYVASALALLPAFVLTRLHTTMAEAQEEVRSLGSYRLIDLLGRGGMGEVWRAEHQLLARPAAVKLIAPDLLGEESEMERKTALARFEREARTTSALRSPHTIALYDYGVASDGALFYVMEHLEGLDLETLVERFGPQPAARVKHILEQACDSLAEAHTAGMIHRDIKPANIYLCRLGVRVDFVKVLDFGLVGVTENLRKTGDIRLTDDDHIVGTPAYMPPEIASGADADGRADLYSLGCVGFWLLTGQFVFEHESAVKMIISHVKDAPDRPSKRLKRPIPEDLEQVILSCLAKDPTERPKNAEELAEKLRDCTVGDWSQHRARKWWEANMGAIPTHPTSASSPTATWGAGIPVPDDSAETSTS